MWGKAMFDWDDLRIFLAVARSEAIGPAARSLALDATTISRRLARLSAQLEADLFEQSGGKRTLTVHGQTLLRHAEAAESAALTAIEEVTGEQRSLSGHVRLSVAEGMGTWLLAPALAGFRAQHPHIRLDIITASGFLNPSKREADMAVMLARPQRGRLRVRRMGDYRLHLYASPTYLETRGPVRTRADLRQHTLVGYVPEWNAVPELDYLDEVDAGLTADLRSTSINVQHRMVRSGAGIGVLPDFIATTDSELVPVLAGKVMITRSFWMVIHDDVRHLARIDAVAQWIERCLAARPVSA